MIAARMNVSLTADAAEFHIRRTDNCFCRHGRGRGDVPRRVNRDAVDRHRAVFADANITSAVRSLNVATLMQPNKLRPRLIADPQSVVFVRRYRIRQRSNTGKKEGIGY